MITLFFGVNPCGCTKEYPDRCGSIAAGLGMPTYSVCICLHFIQFLLLSFSVVQTRYKNFQLTRCLGMRERERKVYKGVMPDRRLQVR